MTDAIPTGYTDTVEVTYSGGEPCTSSFAVAKVIAKHPGEGKRASLENFVIDTAGTTVAAYMARHHSDKKILSYRAVPQRPLTAEAQVRTDQTPLTRAEAGRFEAALAAAAAQGFEGPAVEAPRTQCRRVDPALVDPDWPTHDENGLKPPADGAAKLKALRDELAEAFDDQAAQNDPDDKNALEAWILDAHNSPVHPFQKAATEYLELADDLAFADMEAAPDGSVRK